MKVALTVWENRISPVADAARHLLVVSLDHSIIKIRHHEKFSGDFFKKAARLSELGIEVFICGAISAFLASLVQGHGIRLIDFVRGDADEVLNDYIAGTLHRDKFVMEGCGNNLRSRAGNCNHTLKLIIKNGSIAKKSQRHATVAHKNRGGPRK